MKQALEFLTYDPQLGHLAKQFVRSLEKGTSLKDCFKQHDFQPIVVSFLFFSNESGNLSEHLIHLNRLLTMRLEFQTKLKKLLRYPLFLLTVCIILLFALNMFLLPMFERSSGAWGSWFITDTPANSANNSNAILDPFNWWHHCFSAAL